MLLSKALHFANIVTCGGQTIDGHFSDSGIIQIQKDEVTFAEFKEQHIALKPNGTATAVCVDGSVANFKFQLVTPMGGPSQHESDWHITFATGSGFDRITCSAQNVVAALKKATPMLRRLGHDRNSILGVSAKNISKTSVRHWDSYGCEESQSAKTFTVDIEDQRLASGKVFVQMEASGAEDDSMEISLEVTTLPGTNQATQAAHIHFFNGELAFSVLKDGNGLRIRPERGVEFESMHDEDHSMLATQG